MSFSSSIPRSQPTLNQLLRRIIWSFSLSLLGTWGLLVPRLHILQPELLGFSETFWLYLDLISLSLAIFGIFMVIYHNSRLAPRLSRIQSLGESSWGLNS
ncbi:MAG: hypothetical protein LBF22_09875 [Deltaproteobacteria bacterium]|jgi:Na+-driven multidrug efflux pump|nr:hypothetical protein [Deltaproteobacteria bacterium]